MRGNVVVVAFALFGGLASGVSAQRDVGPPATGDPVHDLLNESLCSIDESYRGTHAHHNDDLVGRFFSAVADRLRVEAKALVPAVCSAWANRDPRLPVTGHASFLGVDLDLTLLCDPPPAGVERTADCAPTQSVGR
jgi:hypothetical protein